LAPFVRGPLNRVSSLYVYDLTGEKLTNKYMNNFSCQAKQTTLVVVNSKHD